MRWERKIEPHSLASMPTVDFCVSLPIKRDASEKLEPFAFMPRFFLRLCMSVGRPGRAVQLLIQNLVGSSG